MICPTQDTLSDLIDGAVPAPYRWRLRWHIQHCSDCTYRLQKEERLRDRVRSIAATATAPVALRSRVESQIRASSTIPIRKPLLWSGRWVAASALACSILVGAFCLSSVSLLHPSPAYAEVVAAMRQIQNARWQEIYSVYDSRTGRSNTFTVHCMARLNPPALRTDSSGRHQIQTTLTDGMNHTKVQTPDTIAQQKQLLREHILNHLLAPESLGIGPNAWQTTPVTVDEQALLRFTAGMGQGRQIPPEQKLTAPGYRSTLWVNPKTLRVVRSEQEYYDGTKHTRAVSTGFEYDQPLPNSLFSK